MRKLLEKYQTPIGISLIILILIGCGVLWYKDGENSKTQALSDKAAELESLRSENDRLKSELENIKVGVENEETTDQQSAQGKININKATQKELESLPGIGPVLAQRIIDYREQSNSFSKSDDLKLVKGISAKVIEKFKDQITF